MRTQTLPASTVIVPWYERDDFQEIWEIGHEGHAPATDYEDWRRRANRAVALLREHGDAVEIVTVRPAAYRDWLTSRGLPNSAAARRCYLRRLIFSS
jgi:hypothetical protein